jgi:hypothetical protein
VTSAAGGAEPADDDTIISYIPGFDPGLFPTSVVPAVMISLSVHLLSLFDLRVYCDQQVVVHVPGPTPIDHSFEAHKIVLSRSPMLAMLMHLTGASGNESGRVKLLWPFACFNPTAFALCLRHLYTDNVLSIDEIESSTYRGANHQITQWRIDQLMFTIIYWLGGVIIQASAIAHQAETIVCNLIKFDIIGVALNVAIDLCNHGRTEAFHNDELLVTGIFALDHRRKMFQAARLLGTKLKEIVFGIIATNTTFKDFQLDTSLEQTLVRPYLPRTRELADHYRPRVPVQTLQFGQFPPRQAPNGARAPSMRIRHTSHIMLNIPFVVLKEAFTTIRRVAKNCKEEDVHVKEFFQKVVAEREARRELVNLSASVSDEEQKVNMAIWGVVGYEESVAENEETGEWGLVAECSEEWATAELA